MVGYREAFLLHTRSRGEIFSTPSPPRPLPGRGEQGIYGADKLAVDNVGTAVNFSGDNNSSTVGPRRGCVQRQRCSLGCGLRCKTRTRIVGENANSLNRRTHTRVAIRTRGGSSLAFSTTRRNARNAQNSNNPLNARDGLHNGTMIKTSNS